MGPDHISFVCSSSWPAALRSAPPRAGTPHTLRPDCTVCMGLSPAQVALCDVPCRDAAALQVAQTGMPCSISLTLSKFACLP